MCIAVVVGLMGPLLNLFHILSPFYEYHNITRKGGLNSPLNCFWYVYGALLQQGKPMIITKLTFNPHNVIVGIYYDYKTKNKNNFSN